MEPYNVRDAHSTRDRGELIVRAAFARFDVVALAVANGLRGCARAVGGARQSACEGRTTRGRRGATPRTADELPAGVPRFVAGSFVGLFYGFLIGMVLGCLIAAVWNIVHHIYLVLAITRRYFAGDL
jgi:hypothetical protein